MWRGVFIGSELGSLVVLLPGSARKHNRINSRSLVKLRLGKDDPGVISTDSYYIVHALRSWTDLRFLAEAKGYGYLS
ncbi:hypothetical protein WAI453_004571 [Rhynchosporium graminicola]